MLIFLEAIQNKKSEGYSNSIKSYIYNTTLNPSYIFDCNCQLLVLCYSKWCVVISTIFKFCWFTFFLFRNESKLWFTRKYFKLTGNQTIITIFILHNFKKKDSQLIVAFVCSFYCCFKYVLVLFKKNVNPNTHTITHNTCIYIYNSWLKRR